MANLSNFGKLTREFAGLVDFAIIYVEEAHPVDGWQFKVVIFHLHEIKEQSMPFTIIYIYIYIRLLFLSLLCLLYI